MTPVARYFSFLAILVAIAAAVSGISKLPIGVVALMLFVGWPVFGTLITLDDDLPGGWSNPDGKAIPEWRTLIWHVDVILCRGSFVVAAFAIQYREDVRVALALVSAAMVMAAFGFPRDLRALRSRNP
jgi:hypothetical protein